MENGQQPASIRLAELVALLSLGTDLGFGQPMEHAIRQCLIALRMADLVGLNEQQRVVTYYSGLLAWVGCHTDSYEQAKWFGDDIGLRSAVAFQYDTGNVGNIASLMFKHIGGRERPFAERIRAVIGFLGEGRHDFEAIPENHYLAADALAERLQLGDDVRESLGQSYDRWDGKGAPGLKGEEILLASRLVNLADVLEVYHRTKGIDAAKAVARARRGTQFDPNLVDLFCDHADAIMEGIDSSVGWDAVIAAEPALERKVSQEGFDEALGAIADFADLKSPYTFAHSSNVASLVAAAGRDFGLSADDVTTVRRAALVHDVGRLGVSNMVWDKRTALSRGEMERVRLHPYLSERMLAFSPILKPLGAIAVEHHERLDGSGYPRALVGSAISPPGRLLAAADTFQTMIEPRPHRPAASPSEAVEKLKREARAGRLDGDAVNAVLRAAGYPSPQRQAPAGLTTRELEVLRLLVRGRSVREIADDLIISRKTAGNHVQHIYDKTGATNRARVSLFAMKHGLFFERELAAEAEQQPTK